MEECRYIADFFNRVLRQQDSEAQKKLYFMKTYIRLINERSYENIKNLQNCFSNALQSLAYINNLTVHVPLDGISSIPLIAKLEANNASLRLDLEFCTQENIRLNYVVDWLLGSKTAHLKPLLYYRTFVQYQEFESDAPNSYNLSALTSKHYYEIIAKLYDRLRCCYQDNYALSSLFIKSEKKGIYSEISNRKLRQYLQELKRQLVSIKSAVQFYVQGIYDSLQSERSAKIELERNSKFMTERLLRQIEENDTIKSDLEAFAYNYRVKTGMLVKVALKQREGEYAGLFAEFKAHADECKQLANLQNMQMMMKEDLVVELRLKLIEMFNRRDFCKEQFRKQFEQEFVPKIVRLQEENGKLRESLSVGYDESLKLTEKVNFLENVKRLLTASNISLSLTNEQLEEQSKQISQYFVNYTLTNDVLRRKINAALSQLQQVANDRDAMIKYNDELVSRYACAAGRYSDIIKAYYVMVVDLAQSSGTDQKEAIELANSVENMAHQLISSPLGYKVNKQLKDVAIVFSYQAKADVLFYNIEDLGKYRHEPDSTNNKFISMYSYMNTPQSERTYALTYSFGIEGVDAQYRDYKGKYAFYRYSAPGCYCLDGKQQRLNEYQMQTEKYRENSKDCLSYQSLASISTRYVSEEQLSAPIEHNALLYSATSCIAPREGKSGKTLMIKTSFTDYQQLSLVNQDKLLAEDLVSTAETLSFAQRMSSMGVAVADMAIQVDAMENEMIQAAGENRRRVEMQKYMLPLTYSTPAGNSLHYRTLHCYKMMHDAELLTLPVQTQIELFRRFISEDLKSELSNSETQTETQKDRQAEPYLYRSLTFSAIPRNSFSRACLTMLPNISRAIEEVNEKPQRLTIKELLYLDVVNSNDELLTSMYSQADSDKIDLETEHDYEAPLCEPFYQYTDQIAFQSVRTYQTADKAVYTDIEQHDRYLTKTSGQVREIEELRQQMKQYRLEAERYYTEAHMLAFDLRQRTKELSYLRSRNSEFDIILRYFSGEKCKYSYEQCYIEQEQLSKQMYAYAYKELEARYRGCEQAFANVLYLAGYLEKNGVAYNALLVVDKIQRFGARLYLLDQKMYEAVALTHKRNEQVYSLLQVLRYFAYFGDPKVKDLFENKEMAQALLHLYYNDEYVIKNVYLQRCVVSDAATQTVFELRERQLRNSPLLEQTSTGCDFSLVSLGCNTKCRPSAMLDNSSHYYALQGAPPFRSKSIYVSTIDRKLGAKDKLICQLLYQTQLRSKELETKGVLLQSSRYKCQQLMEQMQMLNKFYNETPRDQDYERIADLSHLLLFYQYEILALYYANAGLERRQSEAEKAIRFMFGDVEYEKAFSGCLFRPSTMCKTTNYSYTRRRGKNE